mgnify:CR=1 FL=1
MSSCRRPEVVYPCRVPMKVFGHLETLRAEALAEVIHAHLGQGAEEPGARTEQRKGAWISYTFWVTLPDDAAERPLREALQRVPGVVGQL